ncbi:hypothetical protein [Streptomyces hokutonensis]|nr:hypothetical protein [Streptomyces hokutonensis]
MTTETANSVTRTITNTYNTAERTKTTSISGVGTGVASTTLTPS